MVKRLQVAAWKKEPYARMRLYLQAAESYELHHAILTSQEPVLRQLPSALFKTWRQYGTYSSIDADYL